MYFISHRIVQHNNVLDVECNVQLRNLVWATSKHDVYLVSNYSVMHWSSLLQNLTEVLNFSGNIVPTEVVNLFVDIFLSDFPVLLLL